MKRTTLIAAGLVLGLLAPAGAYAQRGQDERPEPPREAREERGGRVVPLQQILAQIARRTPGRHLDSSLDQDGSRQVYRIIWSTNDGRRIDFVVDAQTGRVLSQRGG